MSEALQVKHRVKVILPTSLYELFGSPCKSSRINILVDQVAHGSTLCASGRVVSGVVIQT